MASSAYAVTLISLLTILMPLMLPLALMLINNISRIIMKINGLIGSPCLVDLSMGNGSEMYPLLDTQLFPPRFFGFGVWTTVLNFGLGSQTRVFIFGLDSPTTVLNFGFGSRTTALDFRLGSRTTLFNSGFGSQTTVLNFGFGSRTIAVTSRRSDSSNVSLVALDKSLIIPSKHLF